jgi:biotin carboxyl carrier protein
MRPWRVVSTKLLVEPGQRVDAKDLLVVIEATGE